MAGWDEGRVRSVQAEAAKRRDRRHDLADLVVRGGGPRGETHLHRTGRQPGEARDLGGRSIRLVPDGPTRLDARGVLDVVGGTGSTCERGQMGRVAAVVP